MPKVAIIDCGIGNLFSIESALSKIGLEADVYSKSKDLSNVDAVVLPGVGNFKAASQDIDPKRLIVRKLVNKGIPLFGICLGMQLLFRSSEEGPGNGLGLLEGRVLRLPSSVKTPHMGWNTIKISRNTDFLDGISEKDYFYFVHSYYPSPTDRYVTAAETEYGLIFPSVVAKGSIYGTQFHPEKSGKPGERILRNFAQMIKK